MSATIRPRGRVFTELELQAAKAGVRLVEDENFQGRARATKSGVSITWSLRFYSPVDRSVQKEISCGTWREGGKLKMKAIRSRRDEFELLVRNGIDPLIKKEADTLAEARRLEEERLFEAQRAAQREAEKEDNLSVASLMEAYLAQVGHKDNGEEALGHYRRRIQHTIGSVRIRDLTDAQVVEVLSSIVKEEGKNRTAEVVYNQLRAAFRWADKRQPYRRLLVEGNPIDLVDIGKILDHDYVPARERVLSALEISELDRILYEKRQAYDDAPAGTKYQVDRPIPECTECGIWIIAATLSRSGETALARWEHVDFEGREWFIPRENVKILAGRIHKAHSIYLSDFALAVFKRLHRITGHTGWLFPGRDGKSHRGVKEITKRVSDRQTRFQNTNGKVRRKQDDSLVLANGRNGKWTPHDLRRTGSTWMQSCEIKYDVIDRCQNHVPASVLDNKTRRHYFHYKYDAEMKKAWEAWGTKLAELAPHAASLK